ncbi:tight junction-associated protein 1 [Plakobranchus ocellatus]|uniref:Tight junction-associated protein 1 n=1 Tax=Plakobranchus ocellatus TaxID=259542 RepID=A0AAV4C8S1_9GAST|nr:tight junction-associated protein 1 [Plakobranchus ocellatus]
MSQSQSNCNSVPEKLKEKMKPSVCKTCGCQCSSCGSESPTYFDLHQQIAELHSQLQRSGAHITSIEHELMDSKQAMDLELIKTKEDLSRLRERYDRLLESHKRMQKINHDLEDKLLTLVNQFEVDKLALQKELSTMMNKLVDARILINELDEESEKYRMDCNMAVQLLQCKPSNFVAHKLNTLPLDLQERVRQHMSRDQLLAAESAIQENHSGDSNSRKLIRVPIATFPPTAMVFSLNQNSNKQSNLPTTQQQLHHSQSLDTDIHKGYVPMSIIARVLSQKRKRNIFPRMYLCMNCKKDVFHLDEGCQVDLLPSRGSCTVEISTKPKAQGFVHDLVSRSSRQSQGSISQDSERGSGDESCNRPAQTRVYSMSSGSETNL